MVDSNRNQNKKSSRDGVSQQSTSDQVKNLSEVFDGNHRAQEINGRTLIMRPAVATPVSSWLPGCSPVKQANKQANKDGRLVNDEKGDMSWYPS